MNTRAPAILEPEDETDRRIAAIVADRNALLAECEALRVENAELRAKPEMRAVIGELRRIEAMPWNEESYEALRDLLRRIDRESQ